MTEAKGIMKKMDTLMQSFLEDEISDQEFYDGIVDFIFSYNIRCGEYECNRFIIKKMDHINYIIYDEYFYSKGGQRDIHNAISIKKINYLDELTNMQRSKGLN